MILPSAFIGVYLRLKIEMRPNVVPRLRENIFYNLPMHIGEPVVAAAEAVGEPRVIEAEQVENRGVKVVHVDLVFSHRRAEIIRRAVSQTALYASAGEPR